jgi:hypothetical protein
MKYMYSVILSYDTDTDLHTTLPVVDALEPILFNLSILFPLWKISNRIPGSPDPL